ncbi:MAG: asparagine synthase (glutamine-hydrolyzing) [Clostridiales bacterium]|nr:asparagine synthase (glutamine-hydrolyzing) [Clostridiales bacterium]
MCGIAGIMNIKDNIYTNLPIIQNMTYAIKHRGPDASSIWASNHVLLGHSRLIVVDPYNGSQPMVIKKNNNTYVITYNGEIYNTKELRDELMRKNYSFLGTSDTEVLLSAYIEWDTFMLDKLNGIFSFAIWDENKRRLFLARDRFGVKPLFYFYNEDLLIFGSELKSLLCHPAVSPIIDKTSLSDILFLGPSRTPGLGIFKNVHELKPAHYLTFDGFNLTTKKYWSLISRKHNDSLDETLEKLRFLVNDSINRQLISDVPLCTFLSGGLDSSIITSVAASQYKKQNRILHTYSLNFTDNEKFFKAGKFQPSMDDKWIDMVVHNSNTKHHKITLNVTEQIDSLEDALNARDLPGMADIDSSLLLFCREIKKDFVVALSGECADEIFGGYPWYFNEDVLTSNQFPWIQKNNDKINILSQDLLNLLKPDEYLNARYEQTFNDMPTFELDDMITEKRRKMFYLNYTWFMANLLERKDRMSMSCGLEVRVPFCDHRIVEYTWNIPWDMMKYNNSEKGLLRKAMEGILPKEVLCRKKNPYPKTYNPLFEEILKKRLLDVLSDSSSYLLSLVDYKKLHKLLNADSNYTSPWYGQLMATPQLYAYLIQLDLWFRKFKPTISM